MSRRYSAMSLRERAWPEDLAPRIRSDVLEYFCNGQIDYRVRGVHVRLEVPWDWQAERREDTPSSAQPPYPLRHAVRQGPAERSPPEPYVLAENDIGTALQRRIAAVASEFP